VNGNYAQTLATPGAASTTSPTTPGSGAGAASQPTCHDLCITPCSAITLVPLLPCGHVRFRNSCVNTLSSMGSKCPVCRKQIDMVLWAYSSILVGRSCHHRHHIQHHQQRHHTCVLHGQINMWAPMLAVRHIILTDWLPATY